MSNHGTPLLIFPKKAARVVRVSHNAQHSHARRLGHEVSDRYSTLTGAQESGRNGWIRCAGTNRPPVAALNCADHRRVSSTRTALESSIFVLDHSIVE
jgi:hypothetical protein